MRSSASFTSAILLLVGCVEQPVSSVPSVYDGSYPAAVTVDGHVTCGRNSRVTLNVVNGQAEMRAGGGALVGRVGAGGDLSQLRWRAGGVTETASGRIADGAFNLTYQFSLPNSFGAVCTYRYEGRRTT